jgi:hypothetical protein
MYKVGNCLDQTEPCVVAHIVNTAGVWGKTKSAGFVFYVEQRFPGVRQKYLDCHNFDRKASLGDVQFVRHSGFVVANMFGKEFGIKDGQPPIRYMALQRCINSVQKFAFDHKMQVVCPRIGAFRAGGKWNIIGPMIPDEWIVYTLPNETQLFETPVGGYND